VEATQESPGNRRGPGDSVFAVELALRATLRPHKLNLASLGNVTPHLHWHVVPRFPADPHFPDPVWTAPRRARSRRAPEDLAAALRAALAAQA
jgi:diadenosine tetraphosphate (Ap4A) HIT family hydrolase